jgi:methionine-rich copper-binding protein CopC
MRAVSKSPLLIFLEWQVLSVHTHVTEGVLRFAVGAEGK